MDLSIIIVNYNVKYFLEQALHAVFKAMHEISGEVIVVDNNSADGSQQMLAERFPQVTFIANSSNLGFAKANNQAIRRAAGRYLLLLNPDTVVQEDTFSECLSYMESHPDVGCLGVKMIDGKGRYLPESKRALPTPLVAFYKIFGLSALFPRSKQFGQYHLGNLNKDEIHEVDVISGAFMFIRRTALEKAGLLDEEFFMYGEDIDLSYRIQLSGYRNIYYPYTTIIHYKGESTRKASINYVIMFYRAMIIFARKHFSKNSVRYYTFLIHLAIYFRAGLSILRRFVLGIINPLLDAALIYAGYAAFMPLWEKHHFGGAGYYPPEYTTVIVPLYIAIWLFSVFLTTGYAKRVKLTDLIRGVLAGSLVILIIYALLPESLRFSRAMILMGTMWALFSTISVRFLLSKADSRNFSVEFSKKKKRMIIVGKLQESKRVYSIVKQAQVTPDLIGFVNPDDTPVFPDFIGHIGQMDEIARINQVDELIFCSADVTSEQIIRTMLRFTDSGIDFKIAPPESISVIGSHSNGVNGDLYMLHFNMLSQVINRRKKRLFDMLLAPALLLLYPFLIFVVRNPAGLFRNIFSVFFGFSSWVGYYRSTGGCHPGLPRIRPGILTPRDLRKGPAAQDETDDQANLLYAKDYRILHDIQIVMAGFRHLGRKKSLNPCDVSPTEPRENGKI
jgi:O-antigen biosynthesis protein